MTEIDSKMSTTYIPKILPKAIYKEFFSYVVLAIGVFKSQIEFVVRIQHLETMFRVAAGTFQTSTSTINVNTKIKKMIFEVINILFLKKKL